MSTDLQPGPGAPAGTGAGEMPAARCVNVVHVYGTAGQEVTALRGVDLSVAQGETAALLGPSGSGKTTLLWLLAGLLRPTAGAVEVLGRRTTELSSGESAGLRLRQVGVILQNPARNLLPYETTLGNVVFAQRPTRRRPAVKRRRAAALLDAVGLGPVSGQRAGSLSGGEQQRLAVAVALANGPRLLLADEPTSQLDRRSADLVIELLLAANADLGTTVVAVTHDSRVASALSRTVTIRDGRVGAEGHRGEEYVVVGRDGTVSLPADLLDVLPPGTLARARRGGDGVLLEPAHPGQP
jgi:putative ABC transport system ATP-binding protein